MDARRASKVASRERRLHAGIAGLALALVPQLAGATLYVYDFDGALPPGATLVRATAALDAEGASVEPDTPRFSLGAVASGAIKLAELPYEERVLVSGEVSGITYAVSRLGGSIATQYPGLTTDTPGIDSSPVYVEPHPGVIGNFGNTKPWGKPESAEIHPDGTILIHTAGVGPERRTGTVRTTTGSFGDAGGFTLVRVSDYAPPPGSDPAYTPPSMVRSTFLPNLDITASSVNEYSSDGLASTTVPGDGRSLGYASTDAGASYVRVIDTDDPLLGGALVDVAKHLHHLEPFEWFDAVDSRWKIGAIGVLGDGAGAAGQIFVRADGPTFGDPDLGIYPATSRTKVVGTHMLVDLFPLNSSEQPGVPLRYLHGPDRTQSGIAEISIQGSSETDRILFRPTATFIELTSGSFNINDFPYVMQIGRLANGAIVVPTWENKFPLAPEGIWVADASGEHWATAYARDFGFQGVKPTGANRFWTLGNPVYPSALFSELWQVEAPVVREALVLGTAAREVLTVPSFASTSQVTVSDITGQIPGPSELPAAVPLTRVTSTTVANGGDFGSGIAQPIDAAEGEFVSLVFWMKPMRDDLSVALLGAALQLTTGGGVEVRSSKVKTDLNDWTQVVMTLPVPVGGASAVKPRFSARADASPAVPLDYAFTQPQVVITSQPSIQSVSDGTATAADQLTLALPTLGAAWTVALWGTEARSLVVSLLSGPDSITVAPDHPDATLAIQGRQSALAVEFSSGLGGSTLVSSRHDVFFPTQDLVVVTRSQPHGELRVFIARGMGEIEQLNGPDAPGFAPTELRLGSTDWDRHFEGKLHRVAAWSSTALDAQQIEGLRVTPLPEPSLSWMLASGVACLGCIARARALAQA